MKKILIPAPIMFPPEIAKGLEPDNRTVSFQEFLTTAVDQFEEFGKGVSGIRQGAKIIEIVEKANGEFQLEDADYAKLKEATNFASYNPKIARFLIPFFEALETAETVKA